MAFRIKNPNSGKFKLPDGYADLGWQKDSSNCEQIKKCYDLGHYDLKSEKRVREFDNSLYMNRCTDVITICDECKIISHTDMSD